MFQYGEKVIESAARELGVTPSTIYRRLKRGWSLTEAISMPQYKKSVRTIYKKCARCGSPWGDHSSKPPHVLNRRNCEGFQDV